MKQHLIIGTRGSELALAQTRLAIEAISRSCPGFSCEVRKIHTAGDARTDLPLNRVNAATNTADKGVFIAAIEEALAAGEIDCAVHSLKDMPGTLDPRFEIAAVLPREGIADTLGLKPGGGVRHLVVGTGGGRRARPVLHGCRPGPRCMPCSPTRAPRARDSG